jgi:hypothetical protein
MFVLVIAFPQDNDLSWLSPQLNASNSSDNKLSSERGSEIIQLVNSKTQI